MKLNLNQGCSFFRFSYYLLFFFITLNSIQSQKVIGLNTKSNSLVFNVSENKEVKIIYFGKKLNQPDEYVNISEQYKQGTDYTGIYNSIYTPAGSKNILEPAINVTHSDGNTSLELHYVSHQTTEIQKGVEHTMIYLKDPRYDFEVTIHIQSYFEEDIFEQWTEIKNNEKGNIKLTKYASVNMYLQGSKDYWLTHYHGDWANEMNPEESKLTHGIKVLDSKLGTRTNLFQPSVFMVAMNHPSDENQGSILLGGLQWSGNFKTELELDPLNNLRIISGINDFESEYTLAKKQNFVTPKFWYTLSHEGKGKASRNIHNWARKHKLLGGSESRYTLLNNWEATYFDFDESKLKTLIKDAKTLGVDMFLLDDGWFGNKYPRNNDDAALGDWQVNKKKLPNGIGALVKTANEEDVKFGIWLEPEMVNPDSELYHQHPDWVIKQPDLPEHYFRNQLVLDLSNPEVQDFIYQTVDDLFMQNPGIAYVKWDCNAVIYNAYSEYLDNKQSHLYVDYVLGLYSVLERLREKYPHLPMMLCSGGGGRVDYGALQYFTEFWPSDNTDPLERVFMQWEYSYFYPAIATANHVTNWGKQSIKFKTDVAMMGKLGFDIVVDELSEKELIFSQQALKHYDNLKEIIWYGDLYRLQNPHHHDIASLMYTSKDKNKAVMFNYLVNNRYLAGSKNPIKLNGLLPNAMYQVEEINVHDDESPVVNTATYSGDFLMKVGINPNVNQYHPSVVLKMKRVD